MLQYSKNNKQVHIIVSKINYSLGFRDIRYYWVIQNGCGEVWQLCTKIYVATVWVG
jgi:hypothetical protein